MAVSIAVNHFLQRIPDAVVPLSNVKSKFYDSVHLVDENDPHGFLRVIESVEACLNVYHDCRILHACDPLPPSTIPQSTRSIGPTQSIPIPPTGQRPPPRVPQPGFTSNNGA